MKESKAKIIIGSISLFIAAILVAFFSCVTKKDWIILVFLIVHVMIFLKFLEDEHVVKWLLEKFSKRSLKVIGVIGVFIGIALMPQSVGTYVAGAVEFIAYVLSFMCWILGLLLINTANRQ